MRRSVCPEILDTLPPEAPDAIRTRRDLRWINRLMGNHRWLRRRLPAEDGGRCVEIGAGGGELVRHLHRVRPGLAYTAVDLAPRPDGLPAAIHWVRGDLLDYPDYGRADTLVATLVLHHFTASELARLGRSLEASGLRRILVCEPCRRSRHKWQLGAGRLLGFNRVTLHDGRVSVEAGFRGRELPEALGLAPDRWRLELEETAMGAYRMAAVRR